MPTPAVGRRSSALRVAGEVVLTVAVATFGVWLGLALFGGQGWVSFWTVLAVTLALTVVEVALRPPLRVLAGRGSVGLAFGLGVLVQVYVVGQVLYLAVGSAFERWSQVMLVMATAAVVVTLGRWLVGASDAAYVVGHATRTLRRRPGRRSDLTRGTHDTRVTTDTRGTDETPATSSGTGARQGILIVQIDGLSAPVLRRAIASGQAPTIARWLREGTHRLQPWWAPVPSTTPAGQAALLYGDDTVVPSFRWWDRTEQRLLVSNRPADAALIEGRLPTERGLLRGGVAVSIAFTGGAARSFLVFSQAVRRRGLGSGDAFVPLLASPFLLPRTVLLTVGEMVKEGFQARRQRTLGVQPRIRRRLPFVALRGVTNVLLRTVNLVVVADQMSRGAPVIMVDFVDYDEIAHHAGPERPEAMRAIEGIDGVLAELEVVAARVPTDYQIVVWSDHGQSLGTTFEQLTGQTLAARVRALMADDAVAVLESDSGDDWGPMNTLVAATLGGSSRRPDSFLLGPDRPARVDRPARSARSHTPVTPDSPARPAAEQPDLVVVGGGNLGMIWFPPLPARPTLAELDRRWPGLVPGLALTLGVGVVLVAVGRDEAVAIGPAGTRRIGGADDGVVEGSDPLAPYDSRGVADLRRLSGLPDCGDLVVLSTVDELGQVHAFEHQVGSHGGLGGPQNEAVLLHPTALPFDDDLLDSDRQDGALPTVYGAAAIHTQLLRWRVNQGTLDASTP